MPNSKLKHLGQYLFDILPLTPFLPASCRAERIQAWKKHASQYRKLVLSSKKDPPGPGPGTERIDFVAGHLDILDRKFASLVTFLGLVATVATLTLNIAYNHPLTCLSGWFIAFWVAWAMAKLAAPEAKPTTTPITIQEPFDTDIPNLLRGFEDGATQPNFRDAAMQIRQMPLTKVRPV